MDLGEVDKTRSAGGRAASERVWSRDSSALQGFANHEDCLHTILYPR